MSEAKSIQAHDSARAQEESTSEASSSKRPTRATAPLGPEDFYMEGGFLVFTAAYHLRRGYCCNSGCRHCPYREIDS